MFSRSDANGHATRVSHEVDACPCSMYTRETEFEKILITVFHEVTVWFCKYVIRIVATCLSNKVIMSKDNLR